MGVSHVLQVSVPGVIVGSCVTSRAAKTTTLLSGQLRFAAMNRSTVSLSGKDVLL
jgi:molybdopterin-binding protein